MSLANRILARLSSRSKIDRTNFHETSKRLIRQLKLTTDPTAAMKLAVGGDFDAIGILERETLKHAGLKSDGYLIDVGCGPGRLALPLSAYLTGNYLGIDIVPDFIEFARKLVHRTNWRFETAPGLSIPEADGVADMVCFFSVFTHLLHEQSYIYLREAKRVLKSGGKIVFSYLDFSVPQHWPVFEANVAGVDRDIQLNVFIDKEAIMAWAAHLNLAVESINPGNEMNIPLPFPIRFENGEVMQEFGSVGQSVVVLSVR